MQFNCPLTSKARAQPLIHPVHAASLIQPFSMNNTTFIVSFNQSRTLSCRSQPLTRTASIQLLHFTHWAMLQKLLQEAPFLYSVSESSSSSFYNTLQHIVSDYTAASACCMAYPPLRMAADYCLHFKKYFLSTFLGFRA